jgi:transcriptional/translational regulatory protein YebC/TACO1
LERAGISCGNSQIAYIPTTVLELSEEDLKRATLLLERLEELEDVTNVYANL